MTAGFPGGDVRVYAMTRCFQFFFESIDFVGVDISHTHMQQM